MKVNRLSNIILYVPEGPLERVFKRAGTTTTILFISNGLGIKPIPCKPSAFAY